MNCREFKEIVSDLASVSLMDAERRRAGQQHAEGCGECAARLADEIVLVGGLKELSRADIDSTPAPSTASETMMRAAFRQHLGDKQKFSTPIPAPQQPGVSVFRRGLLQLAAALVILFGAGLLVAVVRSDRADEKMKASGELAAKALQPEPTATPVILPAGMSAPSNVPAPLPVAANRSTIGRRATEVVPGVATNLADESAVTVSIGEFLPFAQESEVVTDFIPVVPGADLPPVESGQVIRVQMPRPALASFGLPFNVERANELVKADVLVGDDGLARAVRFIR